ncbi:hypothetical protein [Spongiactinospora sp. 9N601]|uniref:hypothetical protein n=1 Tax=Spongiactinospora sp. 9N601 TaxID=3375149 RepID=UPI0037B43956
MGWFTSSKKKEAAAAAQAAEAARLDDAQRRRKAELAERDAFQKVCDRERAAKQAHARAKALYDRYAPGPQKDAAGEALNRAAGELAAAEKAWRDYVREHRRR